MSAKNMDTPGGDDSNSEEDGLDYLGCFTPIVSDPYKSFLITSSMTVEVSSWACLLFSVPQPWCFIFILKTSLFNPPIENDPPRFMEHTRYCLSCYIYLLCVSILTLLSTEGEKVFLTIKVTCSEDTPYSKDAQKSSRKMDWKHRLGGHRICGGPRILENANIIHLLMGFPLAAIPLLCDNTIIQWLIPP